MADTCRSNLYIRARAIGYESIHLFMFVARKMSNFKFLVSVNCLLNRAVGVSGCAERNGGAISVWGIINTARLSITQHFIYIQ